MENTRKRFATTTLRVCSEANQGMRKYMEDELTFTIEDRNNKRAAFLAIFDGHGGKEAALFAKKHLYSKIKSHQGFESDDSEQVKEAIKYGFRHTHLEMQNDIENWPKRKDGHNSTSGTTATIALVRGNKLFVAHVGDSAAVLAKKFNNHLVTEELTVDHKPDNSDEKKRIQSHGGIVALSNGVPRVVWKRQVKNVSPQLGDAPLRFEYVPFLAVSRALGDLWSYDKEADKFIVSPEPDIREVDISPGKTKFLILASDGLWGVMQPQEAVDIVYNFEINSKTVSSKRNSSDTLIKKSLSLWQKRRSRADNISVIVAFFDQEFAMNDKEILAACDDDVDSCADTDILSGDEDDTPPMKNNSLTNLSLIRQPAFHCENEISKISTPTKRACRSASKNDITSLRRLPIKSDNSVNKRKSTESPTLNGNLLKKLKTTPISSLPDESCSNSHQCKVITGLSDETVNKLLIDKMQS